MTRTNLNNITNESPLHVFKQLEAFDTAILKYQEVKNSTPNDFKAILNAAVDIDVYASHLVNNGHVTYVFKNKEQSCIIAETQALVTDAEDKQE